MGFDTKEIASIHRFLVLIKSMSQQLKLISARNKATGEVVQLPITASGANAVSAVRLSAGSALSVRISASEAAQDGAVKIKRVNADLLLSDANGDILVVEGYFETADVTLESVAVETSSGVIEHLIGVEGSLFASIDDVLANGGILAVESAAAVPVLSPLVAVAPMVGVVAGGAGGSAEAEGGAARWP